MVLPGNGIYVVKGEMSIIMTAMRRGVRWSSHSHQDEELDVLMRSFQELKDILSKINDLKQLDPNTFLNPFLDVIRSEETTGPVTNLALSAVNKFLTYGLIDLAHSSLPMVVDNIADAVTHARFIGTDQSSDGVVLMKILQVLRTLTLSPQGAALTNDSLCEIMLSCFRICFETRLNELLRRTAEHYLKDMVQLVFMLLPQFPEDLKIGTMKQLQIKPGSMESTRSKRKTRVSHRGKNKATVEYNPIPSNENITEPEDSPSPIIAKPVTVLRVSALSTTPLTPGNNIVDMQELILRDTPQFCSDGGDVSSPSQLTDNMVDVNQANTDNSQSSITINVQSPVSEEGNLSNIDYGDNTSEKAVDADYQALQNQNIDSDIQTCSNTDITLSSSNINEQTEVYKSDSIAHDYVNAQGVRFTQQNQESVALVPYGLVCVRDMFKFLITLCNPLDKQNTDAMIHLGLTLLTVAFEVGADNIGNYSSLLALVKDDLCRNLFSLLNSERLSVFAADLQVCFLLFESLRTYLKFQLEYYLSKLVEIITGDSLKITYEHKEIALDNIVQLWRIPGLVTELYLNYDCDMYCTNLYEDLTKLLAKNAFPATSGIYHTHLLSLDALLTIVESIEAHCTGKTKRKSEHFHDNLSDLKQNKEAPLRIKVSKHVPTREELITIKNIKRWLPTGTEYFNHKPKKGIQFLQEHNILKMELDPREIVIFLRENPGLDKKMIGEYISSRSNLQILEEFVKMFDFTGMRIDEALRLYLETFRLPGEAPLISLVLEHFAEHWHKCNGEPFANADAAFTLAYAVIMLNVDQHNHNVKKQNISMSADGFKRNLKKVNGGSDFDEEMLNEIYNSIKNEEIVMPAEHTGLVKENYLWKVLLRRSASKDGTYIHSLDDTYDIDLFSVIWGPVVAALSFVFDKSDDPNVYKQAIKGFERCAFISAHFNMTQNIDMLILTFCKFTLFNSQQKNYGAAQFGANVKAQISLKAVFNLIHRHNDYVREGWKNVFDLFLSLYSNSLLPKSYMEAEDFIEPTGKIALIHKVVQSQKQDTSLFSSLYSYMVSSENLSKMPPHEEQECIDAARKCIKNCNLSQLITDSKFLHEDALMEMIKALVNLSRGPEVQKSLGYNYNEHLAVFFLELLLKIVLQNRDRVMTIWQVVRDHLYTLVMNASLCDYQYLLERSVIGLLRLAIRLMRNEDISPILLQSLTMLLLLKSTVLFRISKQISYGLYELLKTSAQNIHSSADWSIIFTLLECVGAAAHPPKPITDESNLDQGAKSEGEGPASSEDETISSDRGYTSDSELTRSPKHSHASRSQSPIILPVTTSGTKTAVMNSSGGWILVGNENEARPIIVRTPINNEYSLALDCNLGPHEPISLAKCCESLAFLVRDVAHITPYNFDNCVHCIRTFVEASLHSNKRTRKGSGRDRSRRKLSSRKRELYASSRSPSASSPDEESEDEDLPNGYHQISIQLLDLMHTLHTRTAQIFRWWAEEGGEIAEETSLWTQGWCPLLQGIARLCCDTRQQVRTSAITYLQRALLVHDLQTLNGPEWEACFQRVLFPLLSELLLPIKAHDIQAVEETRMRAATLLSKVFLHHFTSLLSLPTFASLWLSILDYMDKYMHADNSDLLYEAIPESLKNILLVMDSAKVFEEQQPPAQLWAITWERITKFLPHMKEELFREKDVAEVKDEQPLEQHQPQLVQHNIENATKASIILQPPLSEQNIASSLFAHLGQMVSTPIGAPTANETSHTTAPFKQASTTIVDLPTIPVIPTAQPHVQLELQNHQPSPPLTQQTVIYENVPNSNNLLINNTLNQDHQTMPILSPISLYTEYVENPYNDLLSEPLSNHNANIQNRNSIFNLQSQENVFNNENQSRTEENIFQSSQYFCSDSNADFIPSSSEIFSSLQPQLINSQSINIPQLVNNLNIVTSSTE